MSDADQHGIGSYAGGQTCPACGQAVNVVDSYCRYCGAQLRETADQEGDEVVMTDGGSDVCSDGTGQVALSRNPAEREVARPDREGRKPMCPDCGNYVGHTKSGGKPLPETDAEAFGWSCRDCNLTFPSHCHGPDAPGFNNSMGGLKVEFRDDETRWVPVPARYVGGEQA